MRFLADESCDFNIVRLLRNKGYDISSVVESHPGAPDEFVINLAKKEERILLTEDKDFGHLVFTKGLPATGVILIRFLPKQRNKIGKAIVNLIKKEQEKLKGSFVVVQAGSVRIRRLP
jgi:predicted nuclease of predicted toxin-antitoxin system